MINSIHSDLIRGHIDTIILCVLQDGDRYGYDILGEIEKKSGGQYVLKQPTLYSCLKRLESQGFIYKYWGTETNGGRRTYYSLTEMGKELFRKNKDEWVYSRGVIDKLISTEGTYTSPLPSDREQNNDEEVGVDTADVAATVETAEKNETEETKIAESSVGDGTSEHAEESELAETSVEETDGADRGDSVFDGAVAEDKSLVRKTVNFTVVSDEEIYQKVSEEYAEVLASGAAEELSDEAKSEADSFDYNYASRNVVGHSYADGISSSPTVVATKEVDNYSSSLFARDYSEELEDDEPSYANHLIHDETEEDATAEDEEQEEQYENDEDDSDDDCEYEDDEDGEEYEEDTAEDEYSDDESSYASDESYVTDTTEETDPAQISIFELLDNGNARTQTRAYNDFRSYDDMNISDDADRELVVGREYQNVIAQLLFGDSEQDIFANVQRGMAEPPTEEPPVVQEAAATADSSDYVSEKESRNATDFEELMATMRSMGDDIRIRTHSSETKKEYNSLYHYYSNKLAMFKYGILFALMILEIIIPYSIIKFGGGVAIAGEIPVLVISVLVAAVFPLYSVCAFLIDPYKKKRYNFNLKNSLLCRFGIFVLLLVLTYTMNVVFYMDISFEAEYLFSLITPALMATNVPLSAVVFKKLYETKKFAVE